VAVSLTYQLDATPVARGRQGWRER